MEEDDSRFSEPAFDADLWKHTVSTVIRAYLNGITVLIGYCDYLGTNHKDIIVGNKAIFG